MVGAVFSFVEHSSTAFRYGEPLGECMIDVFVLVEKFSYEL